MKKSFIVSMFITLIGLVLAIWFVINNPGEVPINWNIAGEVDEYGSAWFLLMFPGIALLTTLLMYFLPKIDPKGENIKKSGPILPISMVLIATLMIGIQIFIIMAIRGGNIFNMTTFIFLFLGVMFIVMGHFMPRVKHNYMLGIRTPWTLHSEKVWPKTHLVARNWFMLMGMSYLFGIFLPVPANMIIPLILTLVIVIGLVIYSYLLYGKEKKIK